ncbi:hypothetical protein [Glycomyces tenuis]|uniref:hypothetical protein n=1 Tax=Glycomyces tenuis TaxID=58116 RepID=UPI00047A96C4|nr:hypothetical protein [Glycomyces tenuis]
MTHHETGTYDVSYNLVSVLYHTLQEASTIQRYIDDARGNGDEDAARFLEEVQEEDRTRAERAKELLGRHLSVKA